MIGKLMFWQLLCVFLLSTVNCAYKPCQLREYPDGYVCVCNESYCDTFDVERPQLFGTFVSVTSSEAGQRFAVTTGRFTPHKYPKVIRIERSTDITNEIDELETTLWDSEITLTIDREKQYQKIVGFGGAFTGTVSYLLSVMPTSLRHAFYRNYYNQDEGIGYTMMRIPIGGCDFDFEPWAYNESPMNDIKLQNFTRLDKRDLDRIEQINELKSVAQIDEIKLMGVAWSPPKWMKSNNDWTGFSSLKPEYYRTWAEYHLQYLRLMAARNISYWGISTGNEPLNGVIGWWFVHFMSLGLYPLKIMRNSIV